MAFGDGLEGLKKAQAQGKVRFISLSADGEAAAKAIEIGGYDTLQLTCNILDQEPAAQTLYDKPRPEGSGAVLWDRAQRLLAPDCIGEMSRIEVALRWLLGNRDVHTAIVGTTNLGHLEANVAAAERGPLPEALRAEIQRRFADCPR